MRRILRTKDADKLINVHVTDDKDVTLREMLETLNTFKVFKIKKEEYNRDTMESYNHILESNNILWYDDNNGYLVFYKRVDSISSTKLTILAVMIFLYLGILSLS